MKELFFNVLTVSLTCSLLLTPLLLLAPKIHSRYTAKTLYFVWLALGLRMVLPFSFSLPKAPVTVQVPTYTVFTPVAAPAVSAPAASGAASAAGIAPAAARPLDFVAMLALLWAVGVAVFLLWNMGIYLLARRRLLKSAEYMEDNIYQSPLVGTPMVIGLFKSVVLAPEGGADDLALRHEFCHIKRGDLWYKTFFLLVNAVHWFNPLAWLLGREAGRNVELCCDDDVLRNADATERKAYSQLLLSAAVGGNYPALSTQFGSGKKQLKERLQNLFDKKKNSAVLVALVLVAALLAGGLVACESRPEGPLADGTYYIVPQTDIMSLEEWDALTELTFSMADLDVETMDYRGIKEERYTLPFGKKVSLSYVSGEIKSMGEFLEWQWVSSYWPMVVKLEVADGAITSMAWVHANMVQPIAQPETTDGPMSNDIDRTDLDACVRDAILSHWTYGDEYDGDLQTESHVKLKVEEKGDRTTVYAMQLFLAFTGDSSGFYEQRGNSMPVAITFIKEADGAYVLEEFWIPRDGNGYMESIREKFPADISEEQVDTQTYILGETQSCYAQAIAYWNVDTTPIIERLLDAVCAIPGATADNPDSYLNPDYRELTYYGKYTADYCFQALETGGMSNLRAAVVTQLYEELK